MKSDQPKVLYSKALQGSLPASATAPGPPPGPPSSGSIPAPPPGLTSGVLSPAGGNNSASNLVGPNLYHSGGGGIGRGDRDRGSGGDRRGDHYGSRDHGGPNGNRNNNMSGLNSGNNMRGMGGNKSPYSNRHNQPYQNSRMPSNNNNNSNTSSSSPPVNASSVGNGPSSNNNNCTAASTNGSTSSVVGPAGGGPNNSTSISSTSNATSMSASGTNSSSVAGSAITVTTNGNGSVTPEGKSSLLSDHTDRSDNNSYHHHHRGMSDHRNSISKTNLYIRGLTPNTTDKDLHSLCSPYGNIISTKAILDKETNKCRGYGFVDFEHPLSAENAVKSLFSQGVQAQMAKCSDTNRGKNSLSKGGSVGSFNEHDPTNLYIANLPMSMTEGDLEAMLSMYGSVISTRILKDSNGTPRGVGFARMETKEKCDAIISLLNGKMLPGSKDTLLVKFADGGSKKKHYKNSEHRYRNDDLQMSFDSTNMATNGVPTQLLPSPLGAASAYQRAAAFSAATGGSPYQNALQAANPWMHQGPPQYIQMQPHMIPSNMDPNAAAALQYSPLMHQLTAQMTQLQLGGVSGAGYMTGTPHAYGTQAIYPQQLIQSMPLPGEQEAINPSHSVSSGSASGEEVQQQQQQQAQQQQHTFQQMCYNQPQK